MVLVSSCLSELNVNTCFSSVLSFGKPAVEEAEVLKFLIHTGKSPAEVSVAAVRLIEVNEKREQGTVCRRNDLDKMAAVRQLLIIRTESYERNNSIFVIVPNGYVMERRFFSNLLGKRKKKSGKTWKSQVLLGTRVPLIGMKFRMCLLDGQCWWLLSWVSKSLISMHIVGTCFNLDSGKERHELSIYYFTFIFIGKT